ncbi:MAG: hypothetical protein H5T64_10630 [Chloroflexi bacterium]|nr:hypothetical protein [Chloroflexota bacterium]
MGIETSGKTAVQATEALSLPLDRPLKFLSIRHIHAIDDALAAIGAYGEVRLIKNRGKLRFIQTVESQDFSANE